MVALLSSQHSERNLDSRPTWPILQVPGQLGLHSETLSEGGGRRERREEGGEREAERRGDHRDYTHSLSDITVSKFYVEKFTLCSFYVNYYLMQNTHIQIQSFVP